MKTLIILSIISLLSIVIHAQDVNPFESIGKEGKMLTLSKGKYKEFHDNDSLQQIGSVIVNINTGTIYELLDVDTLYSEATLDPTVISRWYSPDPLARKYAGMSPYNFVGGNPIIFIDPDGRELRLSFATAEARDAYQTEVNKALGGTYKVSFVEVKDRQRTTFQAVLNTTGNEVDLTESQQAFLIEYKKVVDDKTIARQKIVMNDDKTEVGSWETNKLDIGDVIKFDEAGEGGATNAGAIIHETVEQLEKAEKGLKVGFKGKQKQYEKAHEQANKAEDKVNGNTRTTGKDKYHKDHQFYIEKNGEETDQTVKGTSNGSIEVIKIKVE